MLGDAVVCGAGAGNTIGHDAWLTDNSAPAAPFGSIVVSGNGVGHDLVCAGNNPLPQGMPSSNRVGNLVSPDCARLAR